MERHPIVWVGAALAVGITGYGVWRKKWWLVALPTSLIPLLLSRWSRPKPERVSADPIPTPEPATPAPTETAKAIDGYVEGVREQLGRDRAGEAAVEAARRDAEVGRLATSQALFDRLRREREGKRE